MYFSYTIVPPVDDNYGALENHTWNGVIGMLERKETDIVISPLTVTYNRSSVVDFSSPYYNQPITIILQYVNEHDSMLGLVKLFTPAVWTAYFVSVFVAVIMIWFLQKYNLNHRDTGAETLCASAWYIYANQMNQSITVGREIARWS